ncbi:MAG: GHMP kinase [Rhodospirillales bacterium]|nr:GHMP kinase [Rhodospirillales bacterium]
MATQSPHREQSATEAIEVDAPARLHFGFLDLNGGLGRRFGSIGLAIDDIATRLTLRRGDHGETSEVPERAARILAWVAPLFGLEGPLHLTLQDTIPEHMGLGSGTQLGLSIVAGAAMLSGREASARALAPLVERGARSGIGIGAFDLGGFLVDAGKGESGSPAPIVSRLPFPSSWRILLIFDREERGLSGARETAAFESLAPFPPELAARLCHITLMRLLPGVAEADFAAVAESIGEIQAHVGDYFAPAQGGRFASPRVAAVLDWLRGAGHPGIGQSSWGPTGFVLVPSSDEAHALRRELERRFAGGLSWRVCAARNHGAELRRYAEVASHRTAVKGR